MNKNTLLQKLDSVLIYLEQQKQPPIRSISEISRDLISLTNESELLLILNKLISDGYAQFEDRQVVYVDEEGEYTSKIRYYIITFDGRFFILTSGYVKENKSISYNSARMDTLKVDQIKRDKSIKNLTVWIAIASCIAGIYYLIEIYKEFYSFFYHHGL
ncbi:hypothetical protein [Mucilaginibacter sp. SP1R1]|uniref:hypothetical protein n=1 Tax=Mucilaginibacter sp. SP1R1 TaxID=2723091 RepID=UPI0016166EC7|nr:hypothetical protein [Mucilaginibacter sp. SP1R1]MBB6152338.1 hypothetical protein [Mucilaginibacter sp. SP1R1]